MSSPISPANRFSCDIVIRPASVASGSFGRIRRPENIGNGDGHVGQYRRTERIAGARDGDLSVDAIARLAVSLDEIRDEINEPCLRNTRRRVARELRAPVVVTR